MFGRSWHHGIIDRLGIGRLHLRRRTPWKAVFDVDGANGGCGVVVTDTTVQLTSAAATANVSISGAVVQASITGAPATLSLGGSANLTFTATNPNPLEMGPLIETWTITDASNAVIASGTGPTTTFTPAAAGTYTVTFSAGESSTPDAETGIATATITVTQPAPNPTSKSVKGTFLNTPDRSIRNVPFGFPRNVPFGFPPLAFPEVEANVFANEFLMPKAEIRSDLQNLDLSAALRLKRVWGVSMAAIIHRAYKMNVITEAKYRRLFTQLGAGGMRTREPEPLPFEQPEAFNGLLDFHRDKFGFSADDMRKLLLTDNLGEMPVPLPQMHLTESGLFGDVN